MRAIKVRIYPNSRQQKLLAKQFGAVRYIYNRALALKKSRYDNFGENLSIIEISKMVTFWKKTDQLTWLKEANAQSLQQTLRHLDKAYKAFFRGTSGFPKFKKKSSTQSFSVVGGVSFFKSETEKKFIKFPKIGSLKCRGFRDFSGKLKTVTISKNPSNQYFLSWCVDDLAPVQPPQEIKTPLGIDLGLKDFAITSEEQFFANPRFFKEIENKLKYYQRRQARSKKGSGAFRKWKMKVARLWQRINDLKSDFLHKLSYRLAKSHDLICVESLRVKNMMKNHKLAKAIADVSWFEFKRLLEYKCDWYGTHFVEVNAKYTSQDCHKCGFRKSDLALKDREWTCPECKSKHDRDINAAKNILIKGVGSVLKSGGGILVGEACETRIPLL